MGTYLQGFNDSLNFMIAKGYVERDENGQARFKYENFGFKTRKNLNDEYKENQKNMKKIVMIQRKIEKLKDKIRKNDDLLMKKVNENEKILSWLEEKPTKKIQIKLNKKYQNNMKICRKYRGVLSKNMQELQEKNEEYKTIKANLIIY